MPSTLETLVRQREVARSLGIRQRRRRREAPRALEPRGPQLRFERALRAMVIEAEGFVKERVSDALPDIVSQQDEIVRQDSPSDDLANLAEEIATFLSGLFSRGRIRRMAEDMISDVNLHNRRQVTRQLGSLLGIDILGESPQLLEVLQASLDEVVEQIERWTDAFRTDVSGTVRRGVRRGLRPNVIAGQLVDRLGIARRRARLIARDQVANANAILTRQRQRDAGITRYRWITSLDERVRDEHADRHGQVFSWDDPPDDGHPGEAINCRCTASPVLD